MIRDKQYDTERNRQFAKEAEQDGDTTTVAGLFNFGFMAWFGYM